MIAQCKYCQADIIRLEQKKILGHQIYFSVFNRQFQLTPESFGQQFSPEICPKKKLISPFVYHLEERSTPDKSSQLGLCKDLIVTRIKLLRGNFRTFRASLSHDL